MKLKALKLHIINQVLQAQDSEVLHTVSHLLSTAQPLAKLDKVHINAASNAPTVNPSLISSKPEKVSLHSSPFSEEQSKDLQKSIDEFFNP